MAFTVSEAETEMGLETEKTAELLVGVSPLMV
jgi:hypothetical protein